MLSPLGHAFAEAIVAASLSETDNSTKGKACNGTVRGLVYAYTHRHAPPDGNEHP